MKKSRFTILSIITICLGLSACASTKTSNFKKDMTDKQCFEVLQKYMYQPVITKDDIETIHNIPFPWNSDFALMPCVKPKQKDFTGSITNDTDKKVTFSFGLDSLNENAPRGKGRYDFHVDAEPGETVYFKIADVETIDGGLLIHANEYEGDNHLSICDNAFHYAIDFSVQNKDDPRIWDWVGNKKLPITMEIFKTHSLQIVYHGDFRYKNDDPMRNLFNNNATITFVEPFEVKEDKTYDYVYYDDKIGRYVTVEKF